MIDFGDIWEVFQVLAKEGGLGVIHAEDNDIVMHMYAKLIREGRVGFENMAEVHNQLSEDLSFRRVLRLAENVPGTALYMMHVSAGTGVAAIAEARAQGPADLRRDAAPVHAATRRRTTSARTGRCITPIRRSSRSDDQKALWDGTLDGTIHCVATDELCCTLQGQDRSASASTTPPAATRASSRGSASCTPRWSTRRGYSLPHYVDLVSTNAAKIMGLYPRKGALAAGSDADITILDPTRRGKVRADDLHETDYTPWEGHDIFAWPVTTILRGKVMVENGQFSASRADGRYLKRKISPRTLAREPRLSGVPIRACGELVAESLALGPGGRGDRTDDGAIVIDWAASSKRLRVEPRRTCDSFPLDGHGRRRSRPAISLVAVLRQVRQALDPGYRRNARARRGGAAIRIVKTTLAQPPIPVSVLTGFLGSGKTTLLRHLLRQPEFSRDRRHHQRVRRDRPRPRARRGERDNFIALHTGCLCCKVRSDLAQTLHDLLRGATTGPCRAFDRIVIETSGLADPAPILHALMTDADLAERVRWSVATTVDAVTGAATLAARRFR